jgi:hypothetical protein
VLLSILLLKDHEVNSAAAGILTMLKEAYAYAGRRVSVCSNRLLAAQYATAGTMNAANPAHVMLNSVL